MFVVFLVAAAGKSISAEEINYVPSLDIDVLNINCVSTTLVEDPPARIMGNSNDVFKVAEHPCESSPEHKTNLSKSEVSTPAGAEVNVAAMSASPSNNKSNSNILDSLPSILELVCSDLLMIYALCPY